jgi:hypothetical protein
MGTTTTRTSIAGLLKLWIVFARAPSFSVVEFEEDVAMVDLYVYVLSRRESSFCEMWMQANKDRGSMTNFTAGLLHHCKLKAVFAYIVLRRVPLYLAVGRYLTLPAPAYLATKPVQFLGPVAF